jgi:hypothetical protein
MLSGSAEPKCRVGLPLISPGVRSADEITVRLIGTSAPADDKPRSAPTTIATRATIRPSAEARCRPGSAAVN